MKRKVKQIIEQDIAHLSDPHMTIAQWMGELLQLAKQYGVDAILKTDAGANNVSLIVEVEK
jgi:hypothetical protein